MWERQNGEKPLSAWDSSRARYTCADNTEIYIPVQSALHYASGGTARSTHARGLRNGLVVFVQFQTTQNALLAVSGMLLDRTCDTLLCGRRDAPTFALPPSVRTVGERAFLEVPALRGLRLGPWVEVLEDLCFSKTGIVEVRIPDNVREIANFAFTGCSRLERV